MSRPRVRLALGVLLAGGGAIRLRGYLVPYTPQLVARVRGLTTRSPDRPPAESLAAADGEGDDLGERTAETLLGAGVLVPDGDRLRLEAAFRAEWREGMAQLRARPTDELVEAVAAATGPETGVELLEADRPLVAITGPGGGEAWVSRPVAIAEVAAGRALAARVSGMATRERLAAARALRGFLERCPVCETRTEEADPRPAVGTTRERAQGPSSSVRPMRKPSIGFRRSESSTGRFSTPVVAHTQQLNRQDSFLRK